MLRCFIIIYLVGLLIGALSGCDNARGKFDQVNLGMTKDEVVKVLGEPQKQEEETQGSSTRKVLRWRRGDQEIVLVIEGERVSGKQISTFASKDH